VLPEERARKRPAPLEATQAALAPTAAVTAGRLTDPAKIGIPVGKVIGEYQVGKRFILDIGPGRFRPTRDQAAIAAEAATDGIDMPRTSIATDQPDTSGVVSTYQSLARVERVLPRPQDHRHPAAPDPPLHRTLKSARPCSCACSPPTRPGTRARH